MLDPRLASVLNELLDSPLRVEIEEVVRTAASGNVNLTAMARQIQMRLDALASATPDQLALSNVTEDGGFRVVWHARRRRPDEESEPVIV